MSYRFRPRGIARASAAALLSLASLAVAQDEDSPSITDAFTNGSPHLGFRYRVEVVDQDGFDDDAIASTLRTRLGYRTGVFRGWSLTLEADNVTHVGNDLFNSTGNGVTDRPVVADPEGTEINQVYAQYDRAGARLRVGRQRINLGRQRFIGGVGWRQNEQTFDGVSAAYEGLPDWDLFYAYVGNVNRIFGPDDGAQPADFDSESHLARASYALTDDVDVAAFAYLLDLEPATAVSTATYGIELEASHAVAGAWRLGYRLAGALQEDFGDNPAGYTAGYALAEASVERGRWGARMGYELLSGDGGADRFTTPLATLHKWQGWADQFLATPGRGVADRYIGVNARLPAALKLNVTYHDFQADSGDADLGQELDAALSRSFGEHFSVLAKLAVYDADTHSVDTNKFWLMLTASF